MKGASNRAPSLFGPCVQEIEPRKRGCISPMSLGLFSVSSMYSSYVSPTSSEAASKSEILLGCVTRRSSSGSGCFSRYVRQLKEESQASTLNGSYIDGITIVKAHGF